MLTKERVKKILKVVMFFYVFYMFSHGKVNILSRTTLWLWTLILKLAKHIYSYLFKGVICFDFRTLYLSQYHLFLCYVPQSDFYSDTSGVVAAVVS